MHVVVVVVCRQYGDTGRGNHHSMSATVNGSGHLQTAAGIISPRSMAEHTSAISSHMPHARIGKSSFPLFLLSLTDSKNISHRYKLVIKTPLDFLVFFVVFCFNWDHSLSDCVKVFVPKWHYLGLQIARNNKVIN